MTRGMTGRKTRLVVWMTVLALPLLAGCGVAVGETGSESLTAADQERPKADGKRLCHPTLGFSLPQPKGYTDANPLAPEILEQLRDANVGHWTWVDEETGANLIVQAAKGVVDTEAMFRILMNLWKPDANEGSVDKETPVRWSRGQGEYAHEGTYKESGIRFRSRCLARTSKDGLPAVTVCVETQGGDADPLKKVREGLTLGRCKASS